MFGYVVANAAQLRPEQVARYRQVYCGLCRTIGERHGALARLSLTYDLSFLVLLLDALDEPELKTGTLRCPAHPLRRQSWRSSRWTDYAADMNVALAYHKCLDDWRDEQKLSRLTYARRLRGAYRTIRQRWPEQCRGIEEQLERLSALERANSADLDAASAAFGSLMARLLTAEESFFAPQMRALGEALGRFIYVMDAVLDEEADRKRGRWNPVARFRAQQGDFRARETLELLMGEATLAFEQLPLEQDLDLLRNILYSGVWCQWVERQRRQSRKGKNKPERSGTEQGEGGE